MPKCLVPINGKPLLAYWFEMLDDAGVGPFLVNLHYMADTVRDFIASNPYRDSIKAVYEETLLGTGGTLLKNREFFGSEAMMLVHADNLSRFDVKAFIERHRTRPEGCEMTMMTFATETPQTCGIVELDNRGVVIGFHEKVANPPGNLASGAVYILEPTMFVFLASLGKDEIDFSTEVLPRYLGRICTFHNDIYHRDIGTPESYEIAQHDSAIAIG